MEACGGEEHDIGGGTEGQEHGGQVGEVGVEGEAEGSVESYEGIKGGDGKVDENPRNGGGQGRLRASLVRGPEGMAV